MHKSAGLELGRTPTPLERILPLIVSGAATSRAAIARASGLARSTVGEQVELLLERGIVEEAVSVIPTRGRPAQPLQISRRAGLIAVADINVGETALALSSLSGEVLERRSLRVPVDHGPREVLAAILDEIRSMVDAVDPTLAVKFCVVGLPAPVDHLRGCAVRPPIMRGGWDGYPVAATLERELGAQVLVDNDANLMALGEASQGGFDLPLLFVKVAEGIGAGIVLADGSIHRGADGSAGDIGHIMVSRDSAIVCVCGKTGCLEALAGLLTIVTDLDIPGWDDTDDHEWALRALSDKLIAGDNLALNRLRVAAADIGYVVAALVHTLNPRTLVLGGPLAVIDDHLLSGVRAAVYEQALPLATRQLTITTTKLGSDAGIQGGIQLAIDTAFTGPGLAAITADR